MSRTVLERMAALYAAAVVLHGTAFASEPPGPPPVPEVQGVLPPMLGDMLTILVLVLDVLLLIGVAYLWAVNRQAHSKLTKLSKLPGEVAQLSKKVETLEARLASAPPTPEPEPEPKKDVAVWQSFVDDYNHLAHSVDIPEAEKACEDFVKTQKLTMLMCLDHAAQVDGKPAPKFVPVTNVPVSVYWAWLMPEAGNRYAVVPNPMIAYDEKMHETGGLKETFASNYESGTCKHMDAKLPALFQNVGGNWVIDQPGMIHLEP